MRTTGRMADPPQFNEIAVANRDGYVVKVSDIGYAEDSYEEPSTAARLDGVPSVTLIVSKQSGRKHGGHGDRVKERLKEIMKTLPKDVHRDHQRSVGVHQSRDGQHPASPD